MELPAKVQTWIEADYCPQRCLLSGNGDPFEVALHLASKLLAETPKRLNTGLESDCLILRDEGQSFKIGDDQNPDQNSARGLIKWISQKPVKAHRIVILENFERASREAPQTLLKILEEPPPQAIFLFTTKNHHQILPTILSRMTVVSTIKENHSAVFAEPVTRFFQAGNLPAKLKHIDAIEAQIKKAGNKEPLFEFLEDLCGFCRQESSCQNHLEKVFQAQEDIHRNVNHRLVLEQLALNVSM